MDRDANDLYAVGQLLPWEYQGGYTWYKTHPVCPDFRYGRRHVLLTSRRYMVSRRDMIQIANLHIADTTSSICIKEGIPISGGPPVVAVDTTRQH